MNKSHLTAIKRNKLSTPTRWLLDNEMIIGYTLDYGCGRGDDVKFLRGEITDGMLIVPYGWDLHHTHEEFWFCDNYHNHHWNTVICNYVLNVVPPAEQKEILKELSNLSADAVYVTVRRDLKEDYKTKRGTQQYLVKLNYPVVKETSGFCIYKVK